MTREYLETQDLNIYHPGFSIDCVVITFHNKKMKVLLNKLNNFRKWMLPGGLVKREEDVDCAARRILYDRVGLNNIYLKQFHLFGKPNRTNPKENEEFVEKSMTATESNIEFFTQRFISMGYFALVRYETVLIEEREEDHYQWFNINEIPNLYTDHNEIINKALEFIRLLVDYIPLGYNLLPEKFTLPDLRAVYEAIFGKSLDKRNFQKKMLNSELIIRLDERKQVSTYPKPYLYIFDKSKLTTLL